MNFNPSVSENDTLFQVPNPFKKDSPIQYPLTLISDFIWETPLQLGTIVVANIAIRIFRPAYSLPVFTTSIAIIATRVVIKGIEYYNFESIAKLKKELNLKYRWLIVLQIVTIIFTIVVMKISKNLSALIAIAQGIVSGMLVEIDVSVKRQKDIQQHDSPVNNMLVFQLKLENL